jgi:HECT-domain (ubiquitin-transferase)
LTESSLASEKAIIVERPKNKSTELWRIARVESFDENIGGHLVCYASGWKRGKERFSALLNFAHHDYSCFTFNAQFSLVLAAREYYVVARMQPAVCFSKESSLRSHEKEKDAMESTDSSEGPHRLVQAIGSRVESSCRPGSNWDVLTLIGIDVEASKGSTDGTKFILVSDDGELFSSVPAEQIRARGSIVREESTRHGRSGRLAGDDRSSLFPFLAIRERSDFARGDGDSISSMSDSHNQTKSLRRTWSALSLLDEMRPVDLKVSSDANESNQKELLNGQVNFECKLEGSSCQVVIAATSVESPPCLLVRFSTHEKLPTMALTTSPDRTFISALKELHRMQKKWSEWPPKPSCRLLYSVTVTFSELPMNLKPSVVDSLSSNMVDVLSGQERRSRKASASLTMEEEREREGVASLCDGVDEICVQCMEIIGLLSDCAEDPSSPMDRDMLDLPGFSNSNLSRKLSAQLDQILCCVGSALPEWCLVAPSFAPHVFTYESRRLLLERSAFGPSRSALSQQEAKVNVGKLRQRMASLRARAVELVGEAFAGGAEDPTALQLQADELYGMEEALAARVRAAFRAVKWQEHALQVAKAAVRRDRLLADAAAVMESYTKDRSVCRRRLEVRFEGESGFDAASGDEAGVTRGFFADVAEALLSINIVAGVCCSSSCGQVAKLEASPDQPMEVIEIDDEAWKLPLWIPDMDTNAQVIIPTPRAAKDSALGVFPRPIPHYHPQFDAVVKMFRLMGRLFAAAMRDGFMFPVPLSSAFLKLVQHGSASRSGPESCRHVPLLCGDLPRPGFLGGEVYAADFYVCRQLDRLDSSNPPLSRHELKRAYEDIATDKDFARVAFGKSYDCSFEEYFQDRTFVDPIDPAQDADAAPLCRKGCAKAITIYNIREWVALAKNFMLHDGVIEQALAFRSGVDDFFSADYLRIFTSEELQRDVCGVGDDVDQWNEASIRKLFKLDGGNGAAEALVAVAAMGGEGGAAMSRRFGPSSPTIAYLVQALSEASVTQRRQFLNFVTSVPIAVKQHWIEVVPILSPSGEFLPMHDPSCLPRANTCSRRLYLPRFESYESFSEVLWAVVCEESKFKGFYEWRGN